MSRRALVQKAIVAREAAQVDTLRQDVEAKAEAARKPVEVICGVPMPVEFGRRDDDTVWISFGVPLVHHLQTDFPGKLRDASAFTTLLNALPLIRDTLRAVRADVRDPDTDTALSPASGDMVEASLRAFGERL